MKKTLRLFTLILALIILSTQTQLNAALMTVETVSVGDAGNDPDSTGLGSVSYEFAIGKYEVTIAQYVTFLNSVASASTDNYIINLWNPMMEDTGGPNTLTEGIARTGSLGSYNYSAIGSSSRPIAYVSWLGAARLANWIHNGATNGADTETGAYTLNGATNGFYSRNPGATWFIPTADEWYKAAYYKGGGLSAGYWLYPTKSNTPPLGTVPPGGGNAANYDGPMLSNPSGVLTNVGAYSSPGPYGTYDQAGNLYEFDELGGRRGGYWQLGSHTNLLSSAPSSNSASDYVDSSLGFRLASIYTTSSPTSAVPETKQLAASALLLTGIALYWFSKVRKTKLIRSNHPVA
jgi:sulfatase modifying factor 1